MREIRRHCTAALLTNAGKRVLVLDQQTIVGGLASVFRRKGRYEFDIGIHYIGDCERGVVPRILDAIGIGDRVEFLELDPVCGRNSSVVAQPPAALTIRADRLGSLPGPVFISKTRIKASNINALHAYRSRNSGG